MFIAPNSNTRIDKTFPNFIFVHSLEKNGSVFYNCLYAT